MGGVSVGDPDYLLLTLSCIVVVVVLGAAKWREHQFLVQLVLSFQLGFVLLFWWNSTMPGFIDLSNPLYFTIGAVGSALLVAAVWHNLGGFVVGAGVAAFMLALLIAGRDKLESEMGGISDGGLAGVFIAVVVVLLLVWWWSRRWHTLWGVHQQPVYGIRPRARAQRHRAGGTVRKRIPRPARRRLHPVHRHALPRRTPLRSSSTTATSSCPAGSRLRRN